MLTLLYRLEDYVHFYIQSKVTRPILWYSPPSIWYNPAPGLWYYPALIRPSSVVSHILPSKERMPLWGQSFHGHSQFFVSGNRRNDSKLSTIPGPALELLWWIRGRCGFSYFVVHCCVYINTIMLCIRVCMFHCSLSWYHRHQVDPVVACVLWREIHYEPISVCVYVHM